jgi:hypothetical protein
MLMMPMLTKVLGPGHDTYPKNNNCICCLLNCLKITCHYMLGLCTRDTPKPALRVAQSVPTGCGPAKHGLPQPLALEPYELD